MELDETGLAAWANALGLEIAHLEGCPGAVLPGRALLIDAAIERPKRLRRIADLLRSADHTRTR